MKFGFSLHCDASRFLLSLFQWCLKIIYTFQQEKKELEEYRHKVATGEYDNSQTKITRKKIKKSSYFSDEEESDWKVYTKYSPKTILIIIKKYYTSICGKF